MTSDAAAVGGIRQKCEWGCLPPDQGSPVHIVHTFIQPIPTTDTHASVSGDWNPARAGMTIDRTTLTADC